MCKILLSFLLLIGFTTLAQNQDQDLLNAVKSFSKTSAVTGREDEAAAYVQSLFASNIIQKDKLGNLIISIGSGYPKRLFTTPLDEPGYVVSQITNDGYLRMTPVGKGFVGNLYHQFMEGNDIKINTENGIKYGVVVIPSSHYDGLRATPEKSKNTYQWQESFIDIGTKSFTEVAAKGIQLLDPVTLNKKPQIIGQSISVSAAKEKAAVIALASVAQTLLQNKFNGTVVIAFTALDLINGKGFASVMEKYGPFDEVISYNRNQKNSDKTSTTVIGKAEGNIVFTIGLPSKYTFSPAELVNVTDINHLMQTWLKSVENKNWTITSLKNGALTNSNFNYTTYIKEANTLSSLISLYGVSSQEKPVRDYILTHLPSWAKPTTDERGNVILTFGQGKQHLAFVAHMDETGFSVDSIRDDGTLVLKEMGGFFKWAWEGHAALVHTEGEKDLPSVFEPRTSYLSATKRANERALTVYAGFSSKQEALDAGVKVGFSSVTMPKQMIRLSEEKATARGFDDRAGCASLLSVISQIDPNKLPFKVTFVWSTGEEIGLVGSTFAAKSLKDVNLVYPIDTYVSADSPVESKIFGDCPLGDGAVIRVLESVNFVKKEHLKYLQALALKNGIKVQYGMTAGGTDGLGFLTYDIPSVPLSWPGRYSHSPVEVLDFRDLANLTKLIKAIIMDTNKVYP